MSKRKTPYWESALVQDQIDRALRGEPLSSIAPGFRWLWQRHATMEQKQIRSAVILRQKFGALANGMWRKADATVAKPR